MERRGLVYIGEKKKGALGEGGGGKTRRERGMEKKGPLLLQRLCAHANIVAPRGCAAWNDKTGSILLLIGELLHFLPRSAHNWGKRSRA